MLLLFSFWSVWIIITLFVSHVSILTKCFTCTIVILFLFFKLSKCIKPSWILYGRPQTTHFAAAFVWTLEWSQRGVSGRITNWEHSAITMDTWIQLLELFSCCFCVDLILCHFQDSFLFFWVKAHCNGLKPELDKMHVVIIYISGKLYYVLVKGDGENSDFSDYWLWKWMSCNIYYASQRVFSLIS